MKGICFGVEEAAFADCHVRQLHLFPAEALEDYFYQLDQPNGETREAWDRERRYRQELCEEWRAFDAWGEDLRLDGYALWEEIQDS